MEESDNRKRSLGHGDENEFDKMGGLASKRAAMGAATGDVSSGIQAYLLKMLCPRDCVGNIIGKGGSVISELNVTTGARIKISQNNEFFPQTNDRVIVISGSTEKIATALTELITKMIEVRKSIIYPVLRCVVFISTSIHPYNNSYIPPSSRHFTPPPFPLHAVFTMSPYRHITYPYRTQSPSNLWSLLPHHFICTHG